ncbi:MAG TPA: hypothetical protein VFN10_22695 [Thermoanaerobaculia bacterium]|nr:hypothetical protein [Thermoanaerobaculia bacterium]
MKRTISIAVLLLFALSTLAFAHAGEMHTYMGTVTAVNGDGSFMMKKTDGAALRVQVANTTQYLHADGSAAQFADLANGARVVVKLAKDGKTAMSVKMGSAKR